jgi:hypothetical protein
MVMRKGSPGEPGNNLTNLISSVALHDGVYLSNVIIESSYLTYAGEEQG